MGTTNLFYPEAKVLIGGYQLTNGVSIDVYSAKDSYYDWARLKLQRGLETQMKLSMFSQAEIMLGYDGDLQSVFKGYIYKTGENSPAECELLLKDNMLKLEGVKITNTFLDAEPQEIVEYCLAQANISNYKIFDSAYPKRKTVPVNNKNVIQVLEEVKRLWGIKDLFYFVEETFYFGQKHEQEKIYIFEYGNNIISLNQESGRWTLETASVPFVRHSDVIEIRHPKLTGQQEVRKIIFSSKYNGFLRTRIYF